MDEYIIKDEDDDGTTLEEILGELKEIMSGDKGPKDIFPGGRIQGIGVASEDEMDEIKKRFKEQYGSSEKAEKMMQFIMNDPEHEFDNVVKWAEDATDIALEQPFLAGTCIAIGKHAIDSDSLPPFIVDGINHGLEQMAKQFTEEFEHPPWIENEENLKALIYGVFQLRITNMVFKTIMNSND